VGDDAPTAGWEKVQDTLDTWFSSGLWTFSTLGWPEDASDLRMYHPTDVLETGYDILFFWVARMILMSSFFLGDVPFRTVYLHGLVRDEQRRKMSKSLGNVIDPLTLTAQYGTDAVRMALVFSTAAGSDIPLSEDKVRGMKHFANKLWNIARFVLMSTDEESLRASMERPDATTEADRAVLAALDATTASVTTNISQFALHEAAQQAYQFAWHDLADTYLEASKAQLAEETLPPTTARILAYCLATTLKLLHPFAPFVTEEIWGRIHGTDDPKKLLMVQPWPVVQ
jgi:valyl-tRNA synthetase